MAWRRPATGQQYVEIEWRKIEMEELRCWRGADLCTAVSEVDAEVIRAAGARRVEVRPNGSDALKPLPPAPPPMRGPVRLLFVGWAAYWPYEHGLAWLAQAVLPRAQANGPVVLDVVGARPADLVGGPGGHLSRPRRRRRAFLRGGARVGRPRVRRQRDAAEGDRGVLPGRPVISTAAGVEGLPLTPGEHYLHAETAAEWVAAIERVRTGAVADLAANARSALRGFTWPQIAAGLAELYRELLQET